MNRFDEILFKYVTYATLLVVALIILVGVKTHLPELDSNGGLENILDILGFHMLTWIISGIYLTLKTILVPRFREAIFLKITGSTERDEREMEVSHSSARAAFFSSLSVLFLMLFLSLFSLRMESEIIQGSQEIKEPKAVSLMISSDNFKLLDLDGKQKTKESNDFTYKTTRSTLPLTPQGIILLIILWQVGTYKLSYRRKLFT